MSYFKIKHICFGLIMFFSYSVSLAQDLPVTVPIKEHITLKEIIKVASKTSLEFYKAKSSYGVNYWKFQSFKSSLLPKINFETNPFTYNRALVERYDSEYNVDIFRQQQSINSFANISLTQRIAYTGTILYFNSSFNRIENFGEIEAESYTATPFMIGLVQPFFAFNSFKWQQKLAPLEYEKAKQNFIYEMQAINLKSIELFFNWALATKNVEIAEENKNTSIKLLDIGKKRYDLIAIERSDLLNLELNVHNANLLVTQSSQKLQKAEAELTLFLRDFPLQNIKPLLPELIKDLNIDVNQAINLAYKNNPEVLNLKIKKMEALRDLDKAIKDNRFDLSLSASYGFNQQANSFIDAYGHFLDQQMVSVQLKVPILDWGERKGRIKTAKMKKEVVDKELQQNEETYKQNIALKVSDFNLQKDYVLIALKSSEIAKESYLLTEKRFLSGNVDFLNLVSSRNAWQSATENYIKSLQDYWKLYYQVQQLTLYDFSEKLPLIANFETLIQD